MNLYQINQNIGNLLEMYSNGEIEKVDFEQALATLGDMEETKIDNTISYIKSLDREAKAIKEEAKALSERAKAKEKQLENLKNYLDEYLKNKGIDKFENARHKVTYRKTPKKVQIEDSDEFMEWAEYSHRDLLKESISPDLTKIKAFIEEGNEIKGVKLVSGKNMSIK